MVAEPFSFNHKQIQAQIRHQFNAQGVSDELMKLQAVRESRLIRSVRPEVITFESEEEDSLAPLPGSVLMVVGRKGDAIFEDLRHAFRAGDRAKLSSLGKELITIVQKRKVVSVTQAVRLIMKAPSLFDLRYRSTTLAPNISLVGGVEIGTISFPYNGGHLDDNEFSIVEYHQADTERDYDVFLVKRSPKLSELERAMLDQVAETSDMLNLGSAACCPGWTVVIVLIFTAVTVAGKTCGMLRDRLAEVELSGNTMKKLGPAATARQLLSLRRDIFAKFAV